MSERDRRGREATEPPDATAAMEVAVRFLAPRPRSRWEVARRLRRASVPEAIVEATLDRLAQTGYVDDAAFARWWGEQRDRHAPRGRRFIEAELRRWGVPSDVVEAYRSEHADPERAPEDTALPGNEEERATDALARHMKGRPIPDDAKARQRIGMFLVRRGFDPETIRTVLRDAAPDADTA